jgi:hypothetical protein
MANSEETPIGARHRHAALCLPTTVLIVARLIDWRDRWSPA